MDIHTCLTPRQVMILLCVVQGKTNKEIAHELGISESTVEQHLWRIYQRLGVSNRVQASQSYRQLRPTTTDAKGNPL